MTDFTPMSHTQIERQSALPLYAQVKQSLQREIEADMKAGDALPTEGELEKRFGVSRITVRRALDELVSEGVIVRQQGRGTFVREPHIAQELPRLVSWSAQMRALGYEPGSIQTDIELMEPSAELAQLLEMPPGERLMLVRRLRTANGEPVCIMSNYLPEKLVPNFGSHGLLGDSLYATLAASGIVPVSAEDRIEARAASEWEAHLLQVPAWSPLLQVTRLTFDAAHRPLYVSVVANRGDRYTYTIHLSPK
jgi:GntR family transcriptional regulator